MEKQILPLLALRGKMVYPNTSVYFEVSRPKSMAALEQAVNHEQRIFLVNQIDPSLDKPEEEDLYTVRNSCEDSSDGKSRTGRIESICRG